MKKQYRIRVYIDCETEEEAIKNYNDLIRAFPRGECFALDTEQSEPVKWAPGYGWGNISATEEI